MCNRSRQPRKSNTTTTTATPKTSSRKPPTIRDSSEKPKEVVADVSTTETPETPAKKKKSKSKSKKAAKVSKEPVEAEPKVENEPVSPEQPPVKEEELTTPVVEKDKPKEKSKKKDKKVKEKENKEITAFDTLISEMEGHEDAWPFLTPVNTKQFPAYKKIIKKPMDLQTMRQKLKSGA